MNRFERAMQVLAVHEGGFVDHPADPGGATNRGVTQRVYNAFSTKNGKKSRSVRMITTEEVYDIYRHQYWNAVKGDELPSGLAYCVFDGAVNSGPSQSIKWMQRALGVADDGVIGAITLSAIKGRVLSDVINKICDLRLAFMKRLRHWSSFKNGWTARVSEVRTQSIMWARDLPIEVSNEPIQPEASGSINQMATIKDIVSNPVALGSIGSVIGAGFTGDGPAQYTIAAVLVLGALVGIWFLVRRKS
jgi:lysozyme family protein